MSGLAVTHVGSLPRRQRVVDQIFAREKNEPWDRLEFDGIMAEEVVQERTIRAQMRETLDGLSSGRRMAILGVAGVLLLAFGYVIFQGASGDGYVAVANGLSADDQSAAVAALEEKKIPYKLSDGGSIEVPKDSLHAARLAAQHVD